MNIYIRPIISQLCTPTYSVAQKLNDILVKYMPAKYSLNSTNEFIDLINGSGTTGILASLDVENLFTTVADPIQISRLPTFQKKLWKNS